MRLRRQEREEPSINLTPLIDVVFLLLIFFMVSTTFQRESNLELTLPEAETESAEQRARIEIAIDAQGGYRVGGKELVNDKLETVKRALEDQLDQAPDRPVVIRADARTPHQSVVRAMDAAGRLGVSKLSIATVQPDE